jgi:extracellular factor (EF) 3-hydroxypalmitic acid methyl ester biosynthesis protein
MEYLLEWHLIYRTPLQLKQLIPDRAPARSSTLKTDATGINIYLEVRKPDDV